MLPQGRRWLCTSDDRYHIARELAKYAFVLYPVDHVVQEGLQALRWSWCSLVSSDTEAFVVQRIV